MNEKWFGLSVDQVEKKLKTNAASGLSRKAARSRANSSSGSVFLLPTGSPFRLLGELLSDFALILLLFVALIALFFEEYQSGVIVLTLLVVYVITAWILYYRSCRTVESLSSFFYPTARVIRGGKLFYVDFRSVVPGDVLLIERGDILCCDARLVTSDGLSVNMRVDRDRYLCLEKMASAFVRAGETRAHEMANMVHAGSVVLSGSGRAIVTAVGKYTYLGAMTGGIPFPGGKSVPMTVLKLRKISSKINMIALIAVLPLSLISLLFSYHNGGTILLSGAFLTSLALAATTMSQLSCTLCTLFYTTKIRKIATNTNGAVIRSVGSLEKLAGADYLFLLDGCVLTDGLLHFHSAHCADGEIRNYSVPSQNAKALSELVSLYYDGATRTLTTGLSGGGSYLRGIEEFLSRSGVDRGALRIRCSIISYAAGNLTDTPERLDYTDRGERLNLRVWHTPTAIQRCQSALFGNQEQPLSENGKRELERILAQYGRRHLTPLIFTRAVGNGDALCFVGILLLGEGIDSKWEESVRRLENGGCRVIAFDRTIEGLPNIPPQFLRNGSVSKRQFLQHGVPLTHRFGSIRTYSDFEKEDIAVLLRYAKRQEKRVLVIGFDEEAAELAKLSDGLITCAPTHTRTSGYLDEEIQTVDRLGQPSALSCPQTVKQEADCLVSRPVSGRGGLSSIAEAFSQIKQIENHFGRFLRYLFCTQLIRILTVAIPMLLGKAILDARHVLFFSVVLDILVFLGALYDPPIGGGQGRNVALFVERGALWYRERPMLIASLASSVAALAFPVLFEYFAFAGRYYERVETLFCSLLLVQLCASVLLKYGTGLSSLKQAFRDRFLLIRIGISLVFTVVCFAWEEFGNLFDIEAFPTSVYGLLIPVPALIFCVLFVILTKHALKFKKRAQNR